MPTGHFTMQSPRDLLAKAERDLQRLRSNPLNIDAAFDFFVTARHVPDWVVATGGPAADCQFSAHVELRTCRHIADGAKYFVVTHRHHKQIADAQLTRGAFQSNAFQATAFNVGELTISLDPADAGTASLGRTVDAVTLATRVIDALHRVVP